MNYYQFSQDAKKIRLNYEYNISRIWYNQVCLRPYLWVQMKQKGFSPNEEATQKDGHSEEN